MSLSVYIYYSGLNGPDGNAPDYGFQVSDIPDQPGGQLWVYADAALMQKVYTLMQDRTRGVRMTGTLEGQDFPTNSACSRGYVMHGLSSLEYR